MALKGDKLSSIFKSLQPDESHFQKAAAVAVQDAEQRWPMFRAVAPVKPATPPDLTDDELNQRIGPKTRSASARKPALSLPGLADKLAQGLGKMSAARSTGKAPAKTFKSTRPVPLPQRERPAAAAAPVAAAAPAVAATRSMVRTKPARTEVSKVVTPAPRSGARSYPPVTAALAAPPPAPAKDATARVRRPGDGAFADRQKTVGPVATVARPAPGRIAATSAVVNPASESLRKMFSRLGTPEPSKEAVAALPRSSFLGRLGRT